MHSSSGVRLALLAFAGTASVALASSPTNMRCAAGAPSADPASELQCTVARSALYRALVATSPLVACDAAKSGARVQIACRFRDGASLRVEREAAIEYTNQEARVGPAFRANPVAVLRRAERGAFGKRGCGIDWRRPAPPAHGALERATVFSGDVCNCQARIERDERARVQTLAFRSAC
jgi:hypothetical protein